MMKHVLHNCAIRASSYAYASVGTQARASAFIGLSFRVIVEDARAVRPYT